MIDIRKNREKFDCYLCPISKDFGKVRKAHKRYLHPKEGKWRYVCARCFKNSGWVLGKGRGV